jgi:hypothetical protein
MGLERGPLSLVSTTEELLGRKSSGSGLESRGYGLRDPPRYATLSYPQELALTSSTSGGPSAGTSRSGTKATELLLLLVSASRVYPHYMFRPTLIIFKIAHEWLIL